MAPHTMTGVALITGAASGIGRSCAHAFVAEGVTRLVLADLNAPGLETVAGELKSLNSAVRTICVTTDTSEEEEVERMVERGVKEFGALHYCVNNAGVTSRPRVKTHELSVEAWDRVQRVNLRGVWLCERAELRQMMGQGLDLEMRTGAPNQRGAIVNISSIFGLVTHPNVGAYAATKAGVLGLSRTDAVSYGREGIRVNSVCPGFIKTPLVVESIKSGANYDQMIDAIPMGRWGLPEEIAEGVVFLCSERASLISGIELPIDGAFIHSSEVTHSTYK